MQITQNNPTVSIITPNYNQGQFIRESIESVVNQNYKHLDYIIIDGGSTDQSVEIIRKYGDTYPFIRWISEKDHGQADAINKGFKLAEGNIIAWLNADDAYLFPSVINDVVDLFQAKPGIDAIYGDVLIINGNNRLMKVQCTPSFHYGRLVRGCYIKQPALFFRRKILEEMHLNPRLEYALDYEFWLRMGKSYKLIHQPRLWAVDRNHPARKIISNRDLMSKESRYVANKYTRQRSKLQKLMEWVDYKIHVGLKSKICGFRKLLKLYNTKETLSLVLSIEFPRYHKVLWNQLFGRNENLY